MDTFADRLKKALKHANIKEHGAAAMLARLLKVTPKAVSKWMNGETIPRIKNVQGISKRTGVRSEWLQYGEGDMLSVDDPNIAPVYFREDEQYPVISWVQAGEWKEVMDMMEVGSFSEWEGSDSAVSGRAFWLKVVGDSMTAPSGDSIPEGHLILVDPEAVAENGSLVVAKLIDDEVATFKKLVLDAGKVYLKPLNPSYRTIEVNGNCCIIGVVKEAKRKF